MTSVTGEEEPGINRAGGRGREWVTGQGGRYLRDAAPATSQQAGKPGGAACTAVFATCLIMLLHEGWKGCPIVMYTMKMQVCMTRAKAYRRKTSCMKRHRDLVKRQIDHKHLC